MIESILIIVFSLVLFAYWFRYTVLLLLNADREAEVSGVMNQLRLAETREILSKAEADISLDPLIPALERDYRLLRYLMDHAAGLEMRPVEEFVMAADFRLLRVWYSITRRISSSHARRALQEMAGILSYMANRMDERASGLSRA
ncbi:MAG: hypothetical protein U0Q18_28600 [Bryobacteraceae bacterium]